MKNLLSAYLAKNAILIVLVLIAATIVAVVAFSKPEPVNENDFTTVKTVTLVSESLHLADVSFHMELKGIPFDKATVRVKPTKLEKLGFTSMAFMVPGETGLNDPVKYFETPALNRRDENIVSVYNIEPWTKEDYEKNPPAGRDMRVGWESIKSSHKIRKDPYAEFLGMQCYRGSLIENSGFFHHCLAEIRPDEWAQIKVDDLPQEGIMVPMIKVQYFSKAYGGLTIRWMTHAKHAPKWKEIDAKLWRLLDERNVAVKP